MSFTAPLWFLLLGLLPLIVILHTIAVRWRRTPVSSLVFWNEVLRERRTSLRIRRLLRNLSLILELMAVTLLAVALAGPRLPGRAYAAAGDTVLVLDSTASMETREGARTRFELAKMRAVDVLAGLRRGARMALITAARSPRLAVPFTANRDLLRRAIQDASPTDEPGDLKDSMLFALTLRDARRGDQVILVTDGAFDSLGDLDTSVPWIHILSVGTARNNVGITGLSFRRTLSGEETYEMFLAVHNFGRAPVSVPLVVTADRAPVFSSTLRLAADELRTLSIPWKGPTTGRVEARIQAEDDFPTDDRAYAVFAPARSVRVLIVGPGSFFLQKALGSFPGVTVHTAAEPETLSDGTRTRAEEARKGPGEDDVVVFDGVEPPPLEKGNFICFGAVPPNLPIRVTGQMALPAVTGWSRSNPLLESISLSGLTIGSALRLEPGPGFTPLAFSHEAPLMLSWDQKGLKVLLVGFDPAQSDLPLRTSFPLLLANALSWFFPSWLTVQADQVQAGTPRLLSVPGPSTVTVVRPDGARESVAAARESVDFFDTSQVGYYRVESGGQVSEFAVSLSSESESDIQPRFAGQAAGTAQAEAAAQAAGTAGDSFAWVIFAIVALALVFLEWLVWLRTLEGARR
jgi:Ca-activated chloride channel family protein